MPRPSCQPDGSEPMSEIFRALVLDQQEGKTVWRFEDLPVSALPEGEVLVEVAYSTLNYKDGLPGEAGRGHQRRAVKRGAEARCRLSQGRGEGPPSRRRRKLR